MIPSLDPGLETRCPPPKESLDVFPSQEQEAVPVLPQAEQLEGTGQDHGQYQGGGQKQMPMAGRMCGAPKVRQVTLGINTQEPRSGCQRKDGQQERRALGSPVSLARPPDPGSKDRDSISCPPDGVVEVSVEYRVGREHRETCGEGLGDTGTTERGSNNGLTKPASE